MARGGVGRGGRVGGSGRTRYQHGLLPYMVKENTQKNTLNTYCN